VTVPPSELWARCEACTELVYRKELERRPFVGPRCGHHLRLTAEQRLQLLLDRGSFVERDAGVGSRDVLGFPDEPPYPKRLRAMAERTGHLEAVVTGTGRVDGIAIAMRSSTPFLGGSMGSAVGEKITRLIEHASARRPLVIVSASGGRACRRVSTRSCRWRSSRRARSLA
jgi:acetyl-CoA carboxylase carboxyl transferase subunit beta